MKKHFFRICSTVLIIVLLINMLPMSIFAEEFRESITTEITQPDTLPELTTQSDARIVGEISSKRTQYSKEFMLSNGLHLAAVYPDAVHYEEEGSWEEIDNTLMLKNGKYVNTAGVWNVSFPQQLSDSKSVTIEKDGYTLSFAMAGELRSTGLEIASTVGGEDAASIKESVMQVFENTVVKEDTPMDVTSLNLAATVPETVPEDTVSMIEETEPKATTEESVPETTVEVVETEPEITEPLPEATVPTEVETEQLITDVMPEQLSVSQMQLSTATVQALDKAALQESYQYAEMAPEKLYSRLSYADVYQNTDVIYDMDSNRVKESIVMEAYSSTLRGYKYTLNVGEMIPVLEEDGQITFYDADQKNVVMVMPAPYLVDAAEESSWDVRVQLTGNSGIYTLTYLLPTQWLADSERAWPVILDPVVAANLDKSNIRDHTVSKNGNLNYKEEFLEVGRNEKRGISRVFLKYAELPHLTSSDVIVAASIMLNKKYAGTQIQVNVHKVQGTWASETLNWSNKPNYNSTIEDYAMVGAAGEYTWYVTDIVRDWYANQNTGMMFKATDTVEQGSNYYYKHFYSSDQSDTGKRPTLAIMFRNNNGLESYWDYTNSSAGRAGTGYVNNFTGNMTWIHSDIGFGGNRMPVSIQHVYNLNDAYTTSDSNNSNDTAGNSFGMGIGWRTNYNQLVYKWSVDSDNYVWEDADGTDHYFEFDSTIGKYKDEDGLEMTLTDTGSDTTKYCITDKNGNCSYFDTYGRLRKQENNQQTKSSINISYYSTSRLITCITDGAGRRYLYMYENGLLDRIEYMGSGSTVVSHVDFTYKNEYDTNRLSAITYEDSKQSSYTYSERGLLCSAADIDGYKLNYTYNSSIESWQPYRVLSVEESDGNAQGGKLTFTYGHNQTTITDHNGNTEIYQFNDFGNTVSIQDDEGHATFAQYARNKKDETAGKANQLKVSSKLQNTVVNLFKDSSFESSNTWLATSATATVSRTNTQAYIGNYALQIQRTSQGTSGARSLSFNLAPDETVTFSAYVKSDISYFLKLQCKVDSNTYQNHPSETYSSHSTWIRRQLSYTNETDQTQQMWVFLVSSEQGMLYMDCAQLELEETASRYNLVENGDFRNGEYGWTRGTYFETTECCVTRAAAAPQLDNTAYRITGSVTLGKHLWQQIPLSGNAGDTYVLSGWAQADSVPLLLSTNRQFAIVAFFHNNDGTTTRRALQFNPEMNSIDDWQYVAGAVVADKAYSAINIDLQYDYNANSAYFDGIQLYKEEFGNSYTYDSNGNVTKVIDLQKQTTTYEYDTNSNLTKIIQDNAAKMTYTYDSWRNVETATTDVGVVYSFTYDTYGNNTSVSIGNGDTKITSEAHYHRDDDDDNNAEKSDEGNRLDYTVDALGKITRYGYDPDTNMLEWVQYPEDTTATCTEYEYDTMYRMAKAECTTDTGKNMSAVYTYTNDYLTSIQTPTTTYDFAYGDFGLRESVKIGERTLATYNYTEEDVNDRKYDLDSLDYGNGDKVQYEYDDKGRVTKQTYDDGDDTVTYTYDNNGALAKVTDSATGRTTTYYYDLTDRMMKYVEKGTGYSHSVGYEYDTKNNLTQQVEEINGTKRTTSYTYDDDNRVDTVTTDGITVAYFYDDYGRIDHQVTKNGSTEILTETYTYVNPTATTTSNQVATYTTTVPNGYSVTYTYTYDDNGNITSINDGTKTITYTYDSANQLRKEERSNSNAVTEWTYDNNGNIIMEDTYFESSEDIGIGITLEYSYGESGWGDLLKDKNGTEIDYDQIGNPVSHNGWGLTWEHGRQLATAQKNGIMWTYTYNADGLRTSKTNEDDTWNYVYNGSQLTQLIKGTDTLYFTYDASGTPLTVKYNGTTYYYATNIQGDIVAILDASGTAVATYSYNAWGYPQTPTGSMASTLGALNPLRYRGYVFDQETGLYYLQSRYYDPAIGRFLNADAFTSTGQGLTGNNMFAYCGNNPASNIDPAGTYYCQVRDNRAVVGGVVSADDLLGLAAGIGIYNLFDEITEKLEKSIAKAKTNKKYRSATETHHIAAKKSYRAAEAKAILTEVLPNGVENPENKIELKTVVHRRIHTNLYYALVNSLVVDAYNSAGNDKLKATENVRGALFVVRVFLEGLDNLVG